MFGRKFFILTLAVIGTIACQPTIKVKRAPERQPANITEYSAETFFETETVFGSSLNFDATAVLMTSDRDGVFNIYKVPVDGSPAVQLTHSESDAMRGLTWFPRDERFLYSSDQGGNELTHIYVKTPEGEVTDLTPGENVKALFLGWDNDDMHFYLASNARDPKAFDVYRYRTDDYSQTMIYQNTSAYDIGDISPNGRYLATLATNSNTDNDLLLIDLTFPGGKVKEISAEGEDASNKVFTFTPDSGALIYGSDRMSEFTRAWRYNMETEQTALEYASDWDVSYVEFSDSGQYRVLGINEDASTKLNITDMVSGNELPLPVLPEGDIFGVQFATDDTAMVFYLNADSSPSNLYHYALQGKVSRLTDTLSPSIDPDNLVTSEVVRFTSFDGTPIPGLLYQPHSASATNPVPFLIYIHGGPGGQTRTGYNPVIQHLVNHGYAIFAVNNRGSGGYGKTFYHMDDKKHGEDDLQDIVFGSRYLSSLPWIDGEKRGVMGGSYGGYLTMAAMTFTQEFDAGINIFGVTNWVRTLQSIPPWWESFREYLYAEMGNPDVDKDRLYRISPLFHADKITKPVLIVQGANDPRVLQVESDDMVAAIEQNQVPVKYVLFPDEGHGFRKKQNRITAQNAYLDFLNTYLNP